MPFDLHSFAIPTAWHIVLRTLMYTAVTLLGAFGGFRRYRGYRRGSVAKQDPRSQALRDKIVFADDFDQLHLRDDVESLKHAEQAGVFRPGFKPTEPGSFTASKEKSE
jgi:hypothetical protein